MCKQMTHIAAKPETLNPKPETRNPKPLTLNPQPSTPKTQPSKPNRVEHVQVEKVLRSHA